MSILTKFAAAVSKQNNSRKGTIFAPATRVDVVEFGELGGLMVLFFLWRQFLRLC